MNTQGNTTGRRCRWFVSESARESFRQKFRRGGQRLSDAATLVNITDLTEEVEKIGVSPDGQKDLWHSKVGQRVYFVVSRDVRENMKDLTLVTCLTSKDVKNMLSRKLVEGKTNNSLTSEEEHAIVETLKKVDAIAHTAN